MINEAPKSRFSLDNLKGDFFGGITAGVVSLPLALAFGLQSGLSPVSGLYCAIFLGAVAVIFGGTYTLISTPTGPMTVVAALTISEAIRVSGSLELAMGTILAIFILSGGVQTLFGIFKLGNNVKYIPYPVLSGFMTGIGIILILFEIYPLIGLASPSTIKGVVLGLPQDIDSMNLPALGLGILTLVILFAAPRFSTMIPATLIALIVGTFISIAGGLNVPLIGEVPQGLPNLQLESLFGVSFLDPWFIISSALTLGALGCIDTLLTAVIVDKITETKHQSNQELIGQGLGNIASGLFGGLPGAGTTMSSIVNVKAGGRTRLSGIISSIFLLAVLLGLGEYAQYIPIPVLAAILISVGLDIIDYNGLKEVPKVELSEGGILIIVLLMTVFVDLIAAVGTGMTLSVFVFMKKMSAIGEDTISLFPIRNLKIRKPCDMKDEFILPSEYLDKIYIKSFSGPIFFGFSQYLIDNLKTLPSLDSIIFEMDRVPYLDQSAAHALELVFEYLRKNNIKVFLAQVNEGPLAILHAVDIVPRIIPEEHIFGDIFSCIQKLEEDFVFKKSGSV